MILFKKHFKKSDSWMYLYWIRHSCARRPILKVNHRDGSGIYFYFLFVWLKLEWYWCRVKRYNKRRNVYSNIESWRQVPTGLEWLY